jgi:CheY-like chemotaxis protein
VLRQDRADDERAWSTAHSSGVLLVNCLPDEQDLYRECLRRAGLDPVITCDVESALKIARHWRPAVIVTDVSLTNRSGLELIAALRSESRTRHTWIIVLSAHVFPAERAAAERAGCDVFLAKPCLPDALVSEVVRVVKNEAPGAAGH